MLEEKFKSAEGIENAFKQVFNCSRSDGVLADKFITVRSVASLMVHETLIRAVFILVVPKNFKEDPDCLRTALQFFNTHCKCLSAGYQFSRTAAKVNRRGRLRTVYHSVVLKRARLVQRQCGSPKRVVLASALGSSRWQKAILNVSTLVAFSKRRC